MDTEHQLRFTIYQLLFYTTKKYLTYKGFCCYRLFFVWMCMSCACTGNE